MEQPKTNAEEIKQKTPESTPENLSVAEVDELLGKNIEIYNNLNSFYKTDIFKDVDFKDILQFNGVGVIDEKFDEIAYGKATSQEKILNFITFGLAEKDIGLIKSKERGLLNKDIFNKEIEGKVIEVRENKNKEERSATEKLIGDFHKELSPEDLGKRQIVKKFEVVDGKIIKIVEASRTEQGMIDAVGKLRDEKIKEVDNFGGDLVKLKEQFEKHTNDKDKFENLKYLSAEGKEDLRIKMAEEEVKLGSLVKDKETELTDRLSIFKEPLEERMNQTSELLDKISGAFEGVKKDEAELNNKLREIDLEIKLIEQSDLLEETKKQTIDDLKAGKNEMAGNLSELAQRKTELREKLNILKTNRQDLDKELSKINKIGKTKEEIAEEKTAKESGVKKTEKNISETSNKEETTGKIGSTDLAEDWRFMGEKKKEITEKEKTEYSVAEKEDSQHRYDMSMPKEVEKVKSIIKKRLLKKGANRLVEKYKEKENIFINDIITTIKLALKSGGDDSVYLADALEETDKYLKKIKK